MKRYAKVFFILSATTLLGCAQPRFGSAPGPAQTLAELPRVQPLQRVSSPVSTVDSLFIMARSAQSAGQLALAEERLAQVLVLQPLHPGALNAIAVIYAKTERVEQAITTFGRALVLEPKAAHLHNNLGYALLLAGRLAESEAELKLARDLSPADLQTGQNLEVLAQQQQRAATGAQLVAIASNVYELRDRATSNAAPQAAVLIRQPLATASLQGVHIEISNGVGVRHLAKRTSQRLAPTGLVTARLTNQMPYRQSRTAIQFGAGQKEAAAALSAQFPLPVASVPSSRLVRNVQLRLVLGHDLVGKAVLAWLDAQEQERVALAVGDGWRWSWS